MTIVSFYLSSVSAARLAAIIFFTLVAGVSNALLLITVNSYLRGSSAFYSAVFKFIIALVIYIGANKFFGSLMQRTAVKLIYDIRRQVLERVIKGSFQKFERMGSEEITGCIVQDTITIGNAASPLINALSALITLVVCLGYIYMLSPASLLFLFLAMAVGGVLYRLQVMQAQKLWVEARNGFDEFLGYVEDLLRGYKELKVSKNKRLDFYYNDLLKAMDSQREYRILGGEKFVNARLIGDIFIFLILGSLVFFFTDTFGVASENKVSLVITLLYMLGPILLITHTFSVVTDTGIAITRIRQLLDKLSGIDEHREDITETETSPAPDWNSIVVRDLAFEHADEAHGKFRVGPINVEIKRGEMVFISGGNGSGKTTFIKMLLGLYQPLDGKIEFTRGGRPVLSSAQRDAYMDMFAPVFYDFHLFARLYGLSDPLDKELVGYYLDRMQLERKVEIVDNRFTTRKLSYGQQKRLALLTAYFEDKPVFVFDEFAAEQDPEFKHHIYHEIFPELKRKGKTVIAITHDDQYYAHCDRLFKMENGLLKEVGRELFMHEAGVFRS